MPAITAAANRTRPATAISTITRHTPRAMSTWSPLTVNPFIAAHLRRCRCCVQFGRGACATRCAGRGDRPHTARPTRPSSPPRSCVAPTPGTRAEPGIPRTSGLPTPGPAPLAADVRRVPAHDFPPARPALLYKVEKQLGRDGGQSVEVCGPALEVRPTVLVAAHR